MKKIATLPAGTYLIGDPCYFVPKEVWGEYLGHGVDGWKVEGIAVELSDGRHIAAQSTDGDGVYLGSDGFRYGVDAGLIGAVEVRRPADRDGGAGG